MNCPVCQQPIVHVHGEGAPNTALVCAECFERIPVDMRITYSKTLRRDKKAAAEIGKIIVMSLLV